MRRLIRFALGLFLALALPPWLPSGLAQSTDFLAALQQYRTLAGSGAYAEALPYAQRLVSLSEREFGADHPNTAVSLNSLGLVYRGLGRLKEAEDAFRRAAAIQEHARGPDDPQIIVSLNNIASTLIEAERFSDAESLLRRAQKIGAAKLPADDPLRLDTLANLARVASGKAEMDEAEALMKQVVAARERTLGIDHPRFADALHNLGAFYQLEGRYEEAESLLQRALTIRERVLGRDHPDVATSLDTLASLATAQARLAPPERSARLLDLAEQRYGRAIEILTRRFGESHPRTIAASVNRASLLVIKRDFPAATEIFKRAIAIEERRGGPNDASLAQPLDELANIYSVDGRRDLAEPLRRRALAIRESTVGPNDPDTAMTLVNLAIDVAESGRAAEALQLAQHASAALIERASHAVEERGAASAAEQQSMRDVFLKHVDLAARQHARGGEDDAALLEAAFASGQMAQGVDTARAINRMATRFAVGDTALAVKVRQRQDLADRRQQLDRDLYRRIGQPDQGDRAEIARLREALAQADADLARLDGEIAKTFPSYADLVATRPVTLADVRSLLGPSEALLSLAVDKNATYLWLIKRNATIFKAVAIGAAELDTTVAALRAGLDFSRTGDFASTKFDVALAYELYRRLLGSIEGGLDGVDNLLVVANGALQSLPPAVLVTDAPAAAANDYRAAHWLIDRMAITVLPSVQTLKSLRRLPRARRPAVAFVGFGDPLLGEGAGAASARNLPPAAFYRRGGADIKLLRRLPRLPETADELLAVAATLGEGPDSVYLRERATKRRVASMDLSDYRVIEFATHGLMAGDFKGLAEPALVLTPPATATPQDDGLLTASDITRLRLNADLVILSACNTAAPDGHPGAEGFSGLAKSFFYAGSRALLVSHWPVESTAAVKLTTRTIREMAALNEVGPAEGLRRAMRALRDDPSEAYFAHPGAWAPFVVVGEGAARPAN
jgi:CHAT domain-containing protein/tetratricopeptide (TPR) repeat protein